jgi:hypothetical protein
VGASVKADAAGGVPNLALTTTKSNSAIMVANGDWAAVDGGIVDCAAPAAGDRCYRNNAGTFTEDTYFRDASEYTVYIGYHANAPQAATYWLGLTHPTGQTYGTVALEIKGSAGADAQIVYVGGQTGNFAGTVSTTTITMTSLTGGVASAPAVGDLVIVGFSVGATSDGTYDIENTAAVDYTLVGTEQYQNDTFDSNLRVAYRFMPNPTETQFRFAGGSLNAADGAAWTVHVFRNVDTGTPMDVTATTGGNINTRLANPPSITPTTSGAWILFVGAGAGGTGAATYSAPYLGDIRVNNGVDTNDGFIGSGYMPWASGAYDGVVFTGGGTDTTNDSWTSVVAALRPASGGGAPACTNFISLMGAGCK